MLKDRKGPYPYPKRDVSKIPMFNYAEMERQRKEQAEQAAKQYAEKKREQMSEDFVLCFFCVFIRTRICFI